MDRLPRWSTARPASTRQVLRPLATTFALTLLTTALAAAGPPPAAAAELVCAPEVPGDVNGDGHAEVAVGEPGTATSAGAVHLFYGTAGGLVVDATGTARNDQLLTQDVPGSTGAAEAGDAFGFSTALGDFDGDGCADLVVGAPGEDAGAGAVTVVPGGPSGLQAAAAVTWNEDDLLLPGSAVADERLGEALSVGDLNGDGIDDLVVGAPQELLQGVRGGGAVMILGSPSGLGGLEGTTAPLSQATPNVPGTPEEGDRFGAALAIADLNGNGFDDLAVGVPGENGAAGAVTILPGRQFTGAGGLPGTTISQASAGVPSASEALDRFGSALAAGEATGDSFAELVVGAPGEDSTTAEPASGIGAVTFFRGATAGVSGTGSRLWTQDSAGVSGVRGSGDAFGSALAMGRLDPGSLADVAIGTPGDAVSGVPGAGSVTVLLGSTEGLTTAGIGGAQFHQNVGGVSGSAETGDAFGRAVTAAPVQTAGRDSLVVGVPGESVRRLRDGMLQQLAAGTAGPDGTGSRSVHLDTAGVQGVPADEDAFGFSVG